VTDQILDGIARLEADLPAFAIREARQECGWSGALVMPSAHELRVYRAELRRAWQGRESDRRMAVYRERGIAAFQADTRRSPPDL
jgi:hypothetical protein